MEWLRQYPHIITDTEIRAAEDATLYSYSPFYYYNNPIPEDTVSEVLDGVKGMRPLYLHTLFLSLQTSEELRRFSDHFGLPYYRTGVKKLLQAPIKIKKVFDEIKTLRLLLQFFHAAEQEDVEKLRELFPEVIGNQIIKRKIHNTPDWQVYDDEDILYSAKNIISEAISSTLEGVSPSFIYDEDIPPKVDWDYKNLLTAIYLMISLDMADGKTPLFCQNNLCGRAYSPGRGVVRYCSQICQTRVKARKYKQRKKKED